MKYFITILLFSTLKVIAQEYKTIKLSELDTTTIEILNEKYTFGNGNVKQVGLFRHSKLSYGQIRENYAPIGRHIFYRRNGKVERVQNYTNTGFMINDTIFRKNGRIKFIRLFKPEYSILESEGKNLYFVDRYYIITYFFKNGNMDCQGLAERTRNIFLIRRDTWKFYKKDGTFKYELKYKESGLKGF